MARVITWLEKSGYQFDEHELNKVAQGLWYAFITSESPLPLEQFLDAFQFAAFMHS